MTFQMVYRSEGPDLNRRSVPLIRHNDDPGGSPALMFLALGVFIEVIFSPHELKKKSFWKRDLASVFRHNGTLV